MLPMKNLPRQAGGTLEEIFSKIFPEPLRRFSGKATAYAHSEERAAAHFYFQNVGVRYEYQKGSEGNVVTMSFFEMRTSVGTGKPQPGKPSRK